MDDAIGAMSRLLGGYRLTQLLYVAAELGVADALAAGPARVEDLATTVHADPDALYRVLRTLASYGIFAEVERRVFSSTPLGDTLRTDAPGSLRAHAVTYGQPWWWNAFGRLLDTLPTGRVAFEIAHDEPLFHFLAHEPQAAAIFNANMSAMTRQESARIADTAVFEGVHTFVDLGGGSGMLAAALLARWPSLRGVVFDQENAIDAARTRGLDHRCELVCGDFFTAVPPGADLYIVKDILHDWTDDQAVAILRNCRSAMPVHARLVVIERLMPTDNGPAAVKDIDVTMLVMTGGRERTRAEYEALLSRAGFTLARVIALPSDGDILEAVPTR